MRLFDWVFSGMTITRVDRRNVAIAVVLVGYAITFTLFFVLGAWEAIVIGTVLVVLAASLVPVFIRPEADDTGEIWLTRKHLIVLLMLGVGGIVQSLYLDLGIETSEQLAFASFPAAFAVWSLVMLLKGRYRK
ncbi:MAG: hypothetical protein RIC16_14925 [Rhodospirillales bacterium]